MTLIKNIFLGFAVVGALLFLAGVLLVMAALGDLDPQKSKI